MDQTTFNVHMLYLLSEHRTCEDVLSMSIKDEKPAYFLQLRMNSLRDQIVEFARKYPLLNQVFESSL